MASVLDRITLHVPVAEWTRIGFPATGLSLDGVSVTLVESHEVSRITAGILDMNGVSGTENIQSVVERSSCLTAENLLQLETVDHLMVRTRKVDSTLHGLSKAFGTEISTDANGERSVWLGTVRVDMVPFPDLSVPSELWGIAFRVADIDTIGGRLGGDVLGAPKPARQEGQRVAVFRSGAGLGVPTALMDRRG
jgi:hypothetical protein